jgi:putative transposase
MRARGYRGESICRVLTELGVQVAPRTYRNWKTATPCARTHSDARLIDALRATIGTPEGAYGRRKMTAHLRRHGHRVAACTVDRLMRDEGMSGVIRGRKHRTTIPGGKDSRRAPNLLDRDFSAAAPNLNGVGEHSRRRPPRAHSRARRERWVRQMRTIVTGGKPWISWPNVSELLKRGRPITDESEFPQPHRH